MKRSRRLLAGSLALASSICICGCASSAPWDPDEYIRKKVYEDFDRRHGTVSTAEPGRAVVSRGSGANRHGPDQPEEKPRLTRHSTLRIGKLRLDEDDYEPVEDQTSIGIEFSDELPGYWLGYEVGVRGSYDEDEVGSFDVSGSTAEIYGGAVKYFGSSSVRPFVGAGLSVISVRLTVEDVGFFGFDDSVDDTSLAGYVHAGVVWDVTESFFIGVDGRVLFGSELSFDGFDTDADYEELALLLGFSY